MDKKVNVAAILWQITTAVFSCRELERSTPGNTWRSDVRPDANKSQHDRSWRQHTCGEITGQLRPTSSSIHDRYNVCFVLASRSEMICRTCCQMHISGVEALLVKWKRFASYTDLIAFPMPCLHMGHLDLTLKCVQEVTSVLENKISFESLKTAFRPICQRILITLPGIKSISCVWPILYYSWLHR